MGNPINLSERAAALRAVMPSKPAPKQIEDNGVILDAFERSTPEPYGGELRVTWSEFKGSPYVGMRLWTRDAKGLLWPSREGVTVRLSELPRFLEALEAASQMAETHLSGKRRPQASE